jgi:hypothetical protein
MVVLEERALRVVTLAKVLLQRRGAEPVAQVLRLLVPHRHLQALVPVLRAREQIPGQAALQTRADQLVYPLMQPRRQHLVPTVREESHRVRMALQQVSASAASRGLRESYRTEIILLSPLWHR